MAKNNFNQPKFYEYEIANEKVLFGDGRWNYNYEQVNTLFNKMGREGRDIYHFMAGKVDLI